MRTALLIGCKAICIASLIGSCLFIYNYFGEYYDPGLFCCNQVNIFHIFMLRFCLDKNRLSKLCVTNVAVAIGFAIKKLHLRAQLKEKEQLVER